ncbi:MAG TPA: TRAM domain-containing protein [Clostridia bacterium]|nr:TRAM domain-containing protein [Clostridia bacterium]
MTHEPEIQEPQADGTLKTEPVLNTVVRWSVTACFAAVGGTLPLLVLRLLDLYASTPVLTLMQTIGLCTVCVTIMAVIGWLVSPKTVKRAREWIGAMEKFLSDMPVSQAIAATVGFAFGLFVALPVSLPFLSFLPGTIWAGVSVFLYAVFGTLGGRFASKHWRDMPWIGRRERRLEAVQATHAMDKLLDTSAIIDGRIFDICKAGFLEGTLVIPQFILKELRHIADSSDPLRRNRGRRGLDILSRIQKELDMSVRIEEADFDDLEEADVKLLRLARQNGGIVVTNDFNLNKVAGVTGVRVLNVNDLANAVKPVLLPGEEMRVQIAREGKEPGQGVGYLEDGTMIVVENARRLVGESVDVVVTTALQTSAGKMIFAKIKAPVGPGKSSVAGG